MCGHGLRLPGSAADGATTGCPVTVPLRAGLVGEPTSVPEAGPCSGCPDQRPGAVHADPVARAIARWRLRTEWFLGSSWGAPVASAGASLPVAPGKPVTRCTEAAPPLAAPVARCSSLRSVPLRSPLRLPGARRFGAWLLAPPESPPPREPEPFSPSLGPKASLGGLGHPVPVGVRSPVRRIPSRMNNPRSRGIFESPGLSPNFFVNPQKSSRRPPFMHRDVPRSATARGRISLTERPRSGLNGRR